MNESCVQWERRLDMIFMIRYDFLCWGSLDFLKDNAPNIGSIPYFQF